MNTNPAQIYMYIGLCCAVYNSGGGGGYYGSTNYRVRHSQWAYMYMYIDVFLARICAGSITQAACVLLGVIPAGAVVRFVLLERGLGFRLG